jgi:hypothetical protein
MLVVSCLWFVEKQGGAAENDEENNLAFFVAIFYRFVFSTPHRPGG